MRDAAADDFEADQLDRLLDPGAVTIGALVLGAEGLFERDERSAVEPARRDRNAELEGLPLVMQAGAAPDLDMVGGEAVLGQPRPRLAFERVDDGLDLVGRQSTQQPLPGAGEIIFDLGIEQPER